MMRWSHFVYIKKRIFITASNIQQVLFCELFLSTEGFVLLDTAFISKVQILKYSSSLIRVNYIVTFTLKD